MRNGADASVCGVVKQVCGGMEINDDVGVDGPLSAEAGCGRRGVNVSKSAKSVDKY